MTTRRPGWAVCVRLAGVLCGAGLLASLVQADVTSSGLGTVVNQPSAGVFDITGGTRPNNGSNLFHSFGNFSVDVSQSANFLNDAGLATNNIISRVTGGNPSNIFGTINTTDFGGANLYLMNPAGILFGPNARLNVGGSFHATTADYTKLGSDGTFYADPAQASTLTMSPPSAFGFLSSNPFTAAIDVQTGTIDFESGQFTNVLQVPDGQTLSFVGGTVNVGAPPESPPAGFLLANGGRINLVSVASPGEVALNESLNLDGFTQLGDINITGNAIIDAKEIFIRGGHLTLNDGTLYPGLFSLAGVPIAPPDGGEVNIEVSGSVEMRSTDAILAIPGIQTYAGSPSAPISGDVPDVNIKANTVSITDGAQITAQRWGAGNPADLTIEADTVEVRNGSGINSLNFWEGPGGTVAVNATDVTLDSEGNSGSFTGISVTSDFHPAYGAPEVPFFAFFQLADSGSVIVNAAGTLSVLGHAQITTDSFSFGKGGDLTINAGNVMLKGAGVNTGLIGSQSAFAGESGNVTVNATETIQMQDGFRISGTTFGSGDGGGVTINAGQSITMSDQFTAIFSATEPPSEARLDSFAQLFGAPDYATLREALGVTPGANDLMQVLAVLSTIPGPGDVPLIAVDDFTSGSGGAVTVTAPVLTENSDARIETSTAWDGNAGTIAANIDSLSLDSGASIRSRSGGLRLDGSIIAGTGNGGEINVAAMDDISISGVSPSTGDGSFISTSTFGNGNGGDISLDAGNNVRINNGGLVSADSLAQVEEGTGLAGDIIISAGNKIELSNGTISTRAVTSDGGNVELAAPKWVYLLDSDITTSVESGFGGGGNITIDPDFVILNKSNILANAFGGPGGNITIVADNVLVSAGSSIDASSELGIDGEINISSPDQEVAKDLAVLPENYLDVTGLISDRCGARADTSSLVPAGPGGLSVDPDGYLPSFDTQSRPDDPGSGNNSELNGNNRWWKLAAALSASRLTQVNCTR